MRKQLVLTLLVLIVGACSNSGATPQPSQATFVTVVGTPFLVAAKIPLCVSTIALAGPLAGVAALAPNNGPDRNYAEAPVLPELNNALDQNCGPPYIVQPACRSGTRTCG